VARSRKKIIISLLLELCFRMACNLVRQRAVLVLGAMPHIYVFSL
jgi:hypothetical protein